MRHWTTAAAVVALFVVSTGCVDRGEARPLRRGQIVTETAAVTSQTYALGTALNSNGAIPRDAVSESFAHGGEVFLSVDVRSASADQTVGVVWRGPGGIELYRQSREVPRSAHYVAFSSGSTASWPRGRCTADVIIDGRSVALLELSIV